MVRVGSVLCGLTLCGFTLCGFTAGDAVAQGLRLEGRVERPLIYLAQRAPESGGKDILSALHDEVLLPALGFPSADAQDVKEVDTGRAVLRSAQQLLSRLSHSSTGSEMALMGMQVRGGKSRPLMVFHTYLREDGVGEIRSLLQSEELAVPKRQLHGRQIYEIKTASGAVERRAGPVEVALVGRDLIVSNDRRTMRRMLDPRTSARGGFGSQPKFTRLRERLDVPAGSLLFYADWQALRPRLDRLFGADANWLMSFSGIQRPEQLMLVARPAPHKNGQPGGIITTVLLEHGGDSRKSAGVGKGRTGTGGQGGVGQTTASPARRAPNQAAKSWRAEGWLDLIRQSRSRELLAGIPDGGVLSFATSVEVNRILPTHWSQRMRRLQATIFRACRGVGIDLRREILRRLSPSAGVRLLMLPEASDTDKGAGPGVRFAWSMRAKSTRDAKELFDTFRRALVLRKVATFHPVVNRFSSTPDVEGELRFRSIGSGLGFGEGPMVLARVRDSIVVAFRSDVIGAVRETAHSQRKQRVSRRRATALTSRLQRLGIKAQQKVAGVFSLDLSMFRDASKTDSSKTTGGSQGLRGLLGLHGGIVQFENNTVRLETFTELQLP